MNNNCKVFLLCKNKATTTIPHPILGKVPACKRCADKMKKLAQPNAATGG